MIPIGLYLQVQPNTSPDRAIFLAVHETVGVTLLVLVFARLGWLARSAPPLLSPSLRPWERVVARAGHPMLYAVIILLPLTGLLLTVFGGIALELYGWAVPLPAAPPNAGGAPWTTLHNQVLPLLVLCDHCHARRGRAQASLRRATHRGRPADAAVKARSPKGFAQCRKNPSRW